MTSKALKMTITLEASLTPSSCRKLSLLYEPRCVRTKKFEYFFSKRDTNMTNEIPLQILILNSYRTPLKYILQSYSSILYVTSNEANKENNNSLRSPSSRFLPQTLLLHILWTKYYTSIHEIFLFSIIKHNNTIKNTFRWAQKLEKKIKIIWTVRLVLMESVDVVNHVFFP